MMDTDQDDHTLALPWHQYAGYLRFQARPDLSYGQHAGRLGVAKSTVMRVLRRTERLRETNPVWNRILGSLVRAGVVDVTPASLAHALGTTYEHARAAYGRAAPFFDSPEAIMVIAPNGSCGVAGQGRILHFVAIEDGLTWVALGWVEAARAGPFERGKLVSFRPAAPRHRPRRRSRPGRRTPGQRTIFGASLPQELAPAGNVFAAAWQMRAEFEPVVLHEARRCLAPEVFDAVAHIIGEGMGLLEYEELRFLPARSAKVLVAIGLRQVREIIRLQGEATGSSVLSPA